MQGTSKKKRLQRLTAAIGVGLIAGAFSMMPVAEALRGGVELPMLDAKGAAVTIEQTTEPGLNISSTVDNNIIKWVSFSIGSGGKVAFDSHNYLNYVTGHARSDILGTLTGGGSIYIVNPNGILIGDGAQVDVGSLYLSTRNLTTEQLAGFDTAAAALFKTDSLSGDVINMGKLNADVISVEGNNITFKNTADVSKNGTLNNEGQLTGGTVNQAVNLWADGGEIHIGSTGGTASDYTVNNGTETDYKLVSTAEELQAVSENTAGNYMLANNITLSAVGEEESNFTPINNFAGRFDGLGYTVNNLTINKANGSWVGVFGSTGSDSVIENVVFSGGSIKGYGSVGIVGYNNGTVRRVYNDGLAISGQTTVGGIVGSNEGKVTQVWNTGTVNGTIDVGGIVGLNVTENATVEIAYNAGDVNGIAGSYSVTEIGGVVGLNIGNIQNVYNIGNVTVTVTGSGKAGGIAGQSFGTVSYAYNTGNVIGNIGSYSM